MPNLLEPFQLPKGGLFNEAFDALQHNVIEIQNPPSELIAFVEYNISQDGNHYTFRIQDDNEEIIAILKLRKVDFCDNEYLAVNKIFVYFRYIKNGIATFLYELAIEQIGIAIISDSQLTMPGSVNLWKSLFNKSDFQFSVLNVQNCKSIKYETSKPLQYLGYNLDYLEVIKEDGENLEILRNANPNCAELYNFLDNNLYDIEDRSNIRFILG